MTENNDVEEVVVEPINQEVESEGKPSQEVKEPAYGSQEYNFREMRRVMEEQQRKIRELEERSNSKEIVEEDSNYDEDDFLTVKQAKKLAQQQAQEMIAKQEYDSLEDKMRLRFKDYDDVVTDENVKKLIEDDADLADSIKRASNPYATAYKLIKKTAFHVAEKEQKAKKSSELEKLQKNSQKPGSVNAINSKPLTQANSYANMSEVERQSLYAEMMGCASRRN